MLRAILHRKLGWLVLAGAAAGYAACTIDELGTGPEASGTTTASTTAVSVTSTGTSTSTSSGGGSTATSTSSTGGMGGAGGATSSSSMSSSSTGGMGPIQELKVATPAMDGTITLPAWLSIKSPTANRTAQTSATTIKIGFGANAARAQSRDGATWGLMVENDRTNYCKQDSNIASGWALTSNVTLSGSHTITGPDGVAMSADEVSWAAASPQNGFFPAATPMMPGTTTWTSSHWLKWANGAGDVKLANAQNTMAQVTRTPTTSWGRHDWTEATTALMSSWTKKQSNSPNLIDHYGCQMEVGAYPTSYIPVGAAANAPRKADILSVTNGAMALPGGSFDVTIKYVPAYASGEAAGDHILFFVDANNSVRFRASDKKIVLKLGGSDTAAVSDALTFNRYQALTVHAKNSAAGAVLDVSGATGGNGMKTDTAKPAIMPVPATIYVLGDDKGATEASDLQQVSFF
jgi:hypothetical protein